MPESPTIETAAERYIEMVRMSRSPHTARAYQNALRFFLRVLQDEENFSPQSPVRTLNEDAILPLIRALNLYAPASERVYVQAVKGFYQYLAAERLAEINLPRLTLLIKQRTRRTGMRLPQFPREEIEATLEYVKTITERKFDDPNARLRAMRDRAFLLTLADTGLRVHEACALRRGDIDWNEGRAILIGKGDKEAVVRFSTRSMDALRAYLRLRQPLDGASGKPLPSLPLFARHDKGAGSKIKPISTTTGRNIVKTRVREALGEEAALRITPHSFRHYFVTTILRATGNLKLAQELARHSNIAVTQRYAHLSDDELDRGYHEVFEDSSSSARNFRDQ